jgi:hypothetical protein
VRVGSLHHTTPSAQPAKARTPFTAPRLTGGTYAIGLSHLALVVDGRSPGSPATLPGASRRVTRRLGVDGRLPALARGGKGSSPGTSLVPIACPAAQLAQPCWAGGCRRSMRSCASRVSPSRVQSW